MKDESKESERRVAERYSCVGDAEIVVPSCGMRYHGHLSNLSATGCFIETSCRLERGTSVEVWLNTEGIPLRVAANLLVRQANGVGLRFHSMSARRSQQIAELIAELAEANRQAAATQPDPSAATPPQPPQPGANTAAAPVTRTATPTLYSVCVRSR